MENDLLILNVFVDKLNIYGSKIYMTNYLFYCK
jgi:hypothetical protein